MARRGSYRLEVVLYSTNQRFGDSVFCFPGPAVWNSFQATGGQHRKQEFRHMRKKQTDEVLRNKQLADSGELAAKDKCAC